MRYHKVEMDEAVSPLKWVLIGMFVAACATLVIGPIAYFLAPGLFVQKMEQPQAAQQPEESIMAQRVEALETHQEAEASQTTAPPQDELDAAIQAAAPADAPPQDERQAALENYLKSQQEQ